MRVTVRFFAILRDRAGVSQIHIELANENTASQALAAIANKFPSLSEGMKRIVIAVNREYVPLDTVLHEGDELALIPPVSGG